MAVLERSVVGVERGAFQHQQGGAWYVGDNVDRDVLCGRRAGVGAAVLMEDKGTYGEQGLGWFAELVRRYGTVRRPGSAALSLAHVAAGWADAAVGTSISAWDVCAARLIVDRAGGHYRPFGGTGFDQPRYAAHTADLDPVALRAFVSAYQADRPGDGAW